MFTPTQGLTNVLGVQMLEPLLIPLAPERSEVGWEAVTDWMIQNLVCLRMIHSAIRACIKVLPYLSVGEFRTLNV